LLLHGYPDNAKLWEDLATKYLVPGGYGVIIPDLLGFDGSDKPTDPQMYNLIGLTNDFDEILKAEHTDRVIISGHDVGSSLATRFYNFHPECCVGLITLNIPVQSKPERPFVLEQFVSMLKKMLGYFPFEYFYLYSDPVNGPALLGDHIESLFTALHPESPASRRQVMCAPEGLKKWLEHDKKGPVQAYATDKIRKDFLSRFGRDGFAAPLCYYRALVGGVFYEQEKDLPAERYIIKVPYLFIAAMQDVICVPQAIEGPKKLGLTPKLTVEQVDAGHWCMLASPKEIGEIFIKWLKENY
jgi:pimeloyl-ACP methyl ester carboxylesterase